MTAFFAPQNTEDYLFQVILEKTIRIPRSLSVKAATVLKAFLEKRPLERLGCSRENAFMDIVNHPFFKSIDWESVSITLQTICILIRHVLWNQFENKDTVEERTM